RAVRARLEADDLESDLAVRAVAQPTGLHPLRVAPCAGDGEHGRDVAAHQLQRRVEPRVAPAREDDDDVRVRGRSLVGPWPDEEKRDRHEPEPEEHLERGEKTAHEGRRYPLDP